MERKNFEFSGDGLEMAILMLKNLFFTIITLGIYRPWATTNMRRYIWGHVQFMGDRGNYTGTGEELFRGWIKLLGILALGIVVIKVVGLLIPIAGLFVPLLYMVVFALATYSGLRYRMSRTLWRQIRFGVDKNEALTKEFMKLYFTKFFLTIISLGIYTPWMKNALRKFLTDKTRLGDKHFSYDGEGYDYAGVFFWGLLLTAITFGIYTPWYFVRLTRFRFEHTKFMGQRMGFDMSGWQAFKYFFVAYLATILTLGIAAPWMFAWGLRLFAKHTYLDGAPDFTLIANQASDGSALADDIVSGYDLDLGF